MKFIYIDESGGHDKDGVFVMCGLMIDAYKLRKKTSEFETIFEGIFDKHKIAISDFKTHKFINGKGGWSNIELDERKSFIDTVCRKAIDNGGMVFGITLLMKKFNETCKDGKYEKPFKMDYWISSAMFIACLVQKKMQAIKNGKGLTVFVVDDKKTHMTTLSEELHEGHPWFDGLYQIRGKRNGKSIWIERNKENRFNQIINTAFAIKSNHSTLIQVSDVISYVYRRHFELKICDESWEGEKDYFKDLVDVLDLERVRLGQCPSLPCVKFYKAATHPEWAL
ncbi:DUF3800 domain-containing protein [Haematospirillum sp. H1815]|uniref:DUF3800 domain-containing protein n=1 Tax=Haematospirillum sp. H1815 TaxID=2723108 RepID=UPI00143A5FB6|nr:DUF3800 domain-containing protein [Haematospirillum sp. H1815]NKD78096.1 DUF3800 domain-containing protein [Haematospirillum sp. H1815]